MGRRGRRWLWRGCLGAGGTLLLCITAGLLWLRTSLPVVEGTISLAGVTASVEVRRDRDGIPYIHAGNERDAYFALGFVHAQDRLWQMELQRRIAAGRLAEILGEEGLRIDRFMRTVGIYRLAEQDALTLPPPVAVAFTAYAAGVNAYLQSRSGAPAPEFVLLRHEPEPWRVADSLAWGRMMALRMSFNWGTELLRARLAKRLPPDRILALWPPYPAGAPVTLATDASAALAAGDLARLARAIPDLMASDAASNAWVLSGRHTATSQPILANDPHLGLAAPNLWYLAHLEAPGLSLSGGTVPGTPLTLLGQNQQIAWAFTAAHSDTADLFVERVVSGGYQTPAGNRPFAVREEVIRIRGGNAVRLRVRETRHGPVISDLIGSDAVAVDHVLALAATALAPNDQTVTAIYRLNHAVDWTGFVEAMRSFHSPQQNILYADRAGNIGYYAPARVPIRKSGDGFMPAPGWSGSHDWSGFIPFEALPHVLNPPSGRIVSANHKMVPDDYPYFLGRDWDAPYRARRIETLLDGPSRHTITQSAAMQLDTLSTAAQDLLPYLLAANPQKKQHASIYRRLRDWDGRMDRNRAEPLIFYAWVRELNRVVFADELGELFPEYWAEHPAVLIDVLQRDGIWCDDTGTADEETCPQRIALALDRAIEFLARQYGDSANWRWGNAHRARFRHEPFGRIPMIAALFDIRIPTDGGNYTLNRASPRISDPEKPFEQIHGAGYRAVYDLSSPGESRFMQATGQSGNPLSQHARDLVERWRNGGYVRLSDPAGPARLLRLRPN